jgi:hypothetical protein
VNYIPSIGFHDMRASLIALFLIFSTTALWAQDVRLLMVEEDGCVWCARWESDIGTEYPKTAEGATAPLLKHNIRADLPDGVTLKRPLQFTPTFVLIVDGQEAARIEGYPGEDFFWGLLARMFNTAKIDLLAKPEITG